MPSNKRKDDYMLVKVVGYNATRTYLYAQAYPTGEELVVAVDSKTNNKFINYLANPKDDKKRYAPPGSVLALFKVQNKKDNFYTAGWAQTVSKKPDTEKVIVTPTTVSPVQQLGGGKTQVLARLLDETPITIENINSVKLACVYALDTGNAGGVKGNRGFLIRTGFEGSDDAFSACFKGKGGLNNQQLVEACFNESPSAGQTLNGMQRILKTVSDTLAHNGGYVEVVGFTDAPVFNYNNSSNDTKLVNQKNFRTLGLGKPIPTFTNAALTIDTQSGNRILKVMPLPGKKIINNIHGLVGHQSKSAPNEIGFELPVLTNAKKQNSVKPIFNEQYPVVINNHINTTNKQFTSIKVQVKPEFSKAYHDRIMAITTPSPLNHGSDYYFKKSDKEKVESALSDVAGTPAIYTKAGEYKGKRSIIILGRTHEAPFANELTTIVPKFGGEILNDGIYVIPEARQMEVMTALSGIINLASGEKPSQGIVSKQLASVNPKSQANIKLGEEQKIKYIDWLKSAYHDDPQRIADEFSNEIKAIAEDAGIDWDASQGNISWPSLDEPSEFLKSSASVKVLNSNDKGSCTIAVSFNSWKTPKGNEQYGIAVAFRNLMKDRDDHWTYTSHEDTYQKYQDEVWGSAPAAKREKVSDEQIAIEKQHREAVAKQNKAAEIANAEAKKAKAFNTSMQLSPLNGPHAQLDLKQLHGITQKLNLKHFENYNDPSNKIFLYDIFDIHNRFVGYQTVLERKILIGKKGKMTNKIFNSGLTKDDVATGHPLGAHRVVGVIDPKVPHKIFYSEGWANAGSNEQVTDTASVICLDKDNMKKVIGLFMKKYPHHEHIHVADNDMFSSKNGNPGLLVAVENSFNFGIPYVTPDLSRVPNYVDNKLSDTSDLFVNLGAEELVKQLSKTSSINGDVVMYHGLRLVYVRENKVEEQVALLLKACEKEMTLAESVPIISSIIDGRNSEYRKVEVNYRPTYIGSEITLEFLSKIKTKFANLELPGKIDYSLPKIIKSEEDQPMRDNGDLPLWQVTVNRSAHPKTPKKSVALIKDYSGQHGSFIAKKLEALGIEYSFDIKNSRFITPYKYINIVNSGLSELTGAPLLYSGKPVDKSKSGIVIRGDFSRTDVKRKLAKTVDQVGGEFIDAEQGFYIENPNTFVFIKELLINQFKPRNPEAFDESLTHLASEQAKVQTGIIDVAERFGLTRKALAQHQIYLNQHNPQIGELYSPLVAGLYLKSKNVLLAHTDFNEYTPEEKIYLALNQLRQELKTLQQTDAFLYESFRTDVQQSIQILDRQFKVTSRELNEVDQQTVVSEPTDDASDIETIVEESVAEEEAAVETVVEEPATEEEAAVEAVAEEPATEEEEAAAAPALDLNLKEQIGAFLEESAVDATQEQKAEIIFEQLIVLDTEAVTLEEKPHLSELEMRLADLLSFASVYLENDFNEAEFAEAIKAPGSPYYSIKEGFEKILLTADLLENSDSNIAHFFEKPSNISTASELFISLRRQQTMERLAALEVYVTTTLSHKPDFNPENTSGIRKKPMNHGVPNPYANESGFQEELLQNDLLEIDGFDDITTFRGYFRVQQQRYLNSLESTFETADVVQDFSKGFASENENTNFVTPLSINDRSYYLVHQSNKDYETNVWVQYEAGDSALIADELPNVNSMVSHDVGCHHIELISIESEKSKTYIAFDINTEDTTINSKQFSSCFDGTQVVARLVKTHKPAEIIEQVTDAVSIIQDDTLTSQEMAEQIANATLSNIYDPELIDNLIEQHQPVQEIAPQASTLQDYDVLYALAVQCAKDNMTYTEFYDAVFNDDGVRFEQNPFVDNGRVNKSSVVKSLRANGFKSPKGFYDAAFTSVHSKSQHDVELSRTTGITPTAIDIKVPLRHQFSSLTKLLTEGDDYNKDDARRIISQSFRTWLKQPDSVTAIHPILSIDLLNVDATELLANYSNDAIRLLADLHAISANEDNSIEGLAQKTIKQWKSRVTLTDIQKEGFLELDTDTQRSLANDIDTTASASAIELAKNVYAKLNKLNEVTELRLSEYSYIRAALTAERNAIEVPSFVYQELSNIIAFENQFGSIVQNKLSRIESAKLLKSALDSMSYIGQMSDLERAVADIEEIPSDAVFIGEEKLRAKQPGNFKYKLISGDITSLNLPLHIPYYSTYGENIFITPEPLSLEFLKNLEAQPVNFASIFEVLSPVEEIFNKSKYLAFSTNLGSYGVITQNKRTFILDVSSEKEGQIQTNSYKSKTLKEALNTAFDLFPADRIELQDGFSDEFIHRFSSENAASLSALEHVSIQIINHNSTELADLVVNKSIDLKVIEKGNISADEMGNVAVRIIDDLVDDLRLDTLSRATYGTEVLKENSQQLIDFIGSEELIQSKDEVLEQAKVSVADNSGNDLLSYDSVNLLTGETYTSYLYAVNQKLIEGIETAREEFSTVGTPFKLPEDITQIAEWVFRYELKEEMEAPAESHLQSSHKEMVDKFNTQELSVSFVRNRWDDTVVIEIGNYQLRGKLNPIRVGATEFSALYNGEIISTPLKLAEAFEKVVSHNFNNSQLSSANEDLLAQLAQQSLQQLNAVVAVVGDTSDDENVDLVTTPSQFESYRVKYLELIANNELNQLNILNSEHARLDERLEDAEADILADMVSEAFEAQAINSENLADNFLDSEFVTLAKELGADIAVSNEQFVFSTSEVTEQASINSADDVKALKQSIESWISQAPERSIAVETELLQEHVKEKQLPDGWEMTFEKGYLDNDSVKGYFSPEYIITIKDYENQIFDLVGEKAESFSFGIADSDFSGGKQFYVEYGGGENHYLDDLDKAVELINTVIASELNAARNNNDNVLTPGPSIIDSADLKPITVGEVDFSVLSYDAIDQHGMFGRTLHDAAIKNIEAVVKYLENDIPKDAAPREDLDRAIELAKAQYGAHIYDLAEPKEADINAATEVLPTIDRVEEFLNAGRGELNPAEADEPRNTFNNIERLAKEYDIKTTAYINVDFEDTDDNALKVALTKGNEKAVIQILGDGKAAVFGVDGKRVGKFGQHSFYKIYSNDSDTQRDRLEAFALASNDLIQAGTPETEVAYELITHTTRKDKEIQGFVIKDVTLAEAKTVDKYTFKKDGGFFIREKHLEKLEQFDSNRLSESDQSPEMPAEDVSKQNLNEQQIQQQQDRNKSQDEHINKEYERQESVKQDKEQQAAALAKLELKASLLEGEHVFDSKVEMLRSKAYKNGATIETLKPTITSKGDNSVTAPLKFVLTFEDTLPEEKAESKSVNVGESFSVEGYNFNIMSINLDSNEIMVNDGHSEFPMTKSELIGFGIQIAGLTDSATLQGHEAKVKANEAIISSNRQKLFTEVSNVTNLVRDYVSDNTEWRKLGGNTERLMFTSPDEKTTDGTDRSMGYGEISKSPSTGKWEATFNANGETLPFDRKRDAKDFALRLAAITLKKDGYSLSVNMADSIQLLETDFFSMDNSQRRLNTDIQSRIKNLTEEVKTAGGSWFKMMRNLDSLDESEQRNGFAVARKALQVESAAIESVLELEANQTFIDHHGEVTSAGQVVGGMLDGSPTFGIVQNNADNELVVIPYRFQSTLKNIKSGQDKATHYSNEGTNDFALDLTNVDKGLTLALPVYGLTKAEYTAYVLADGKTNNQSIENALHKLNNLKKASLKELLDLSALVGTKPNPSENGDLRGHYTKELETYLKLTRLAEFSDDLITEQEKTFIKDNIGSELSIQQWSESRKDEIRGRIISLAHQQAVSIGAKHGYDNQLVEHENNIAKATPIADFETIYPIKDGPFNQTMRTAQPIELLLAKVNSSNAVVNLASSLLVNDTDLRLLQGLSKESESDLVSVSVKRGQWSVNSPETGERIALPLNEIVASYSSDIPEILFPANVDAFFIENGMLKQGQILTDVYINDEKAELYIEEEDGERNYYPVSPSNIFPDVKGIYADARLLGTSFLENTLQQQLQIEILPADIVSSENRTGNEYPASILAARDINHQFAKVLARAKAPNGYVVAITNGQYQLLNIDPERQNVVFDDITKIGNTESLRKAILLAKRSNIGENKNDNNAKSSRSRTSETPERVLPGTIQGTVGEEHTGAVPTQETKATDGADRDKSEATGASPSGAGESGLAGENNLPSGNQDGRGTASKRNGISSNGRSLGPKPNIKYTYSDEIKTAISQKLGVEARFELNLDAIKLAKQLTKENRVATPEEKNTLAQYRGWGGLAEIVDDRIHRHTSRRVSLKALLTTEEYVSIQRSTLSAFYTSPVLTEAVWSGMVRMGLKGGIGLDPAFGIGNFVSAIPDSLVENVTMHGKEIDSLTAEIARHLHGKFITNERYEKSKIPSNYFDFSTTNVPFGDFKVFDRQHRDLSKHNIHDFFILKELNDVKLGGFVSVITTSGTMDKKSSKVRKLISEQADLVGAIRLPSNVFEDNANTTVKSDILFFQKRMPNTEPSNTDWIEVAEHLIKPLRYGAEEFVTFNPYFVNHPEMVIGDIRAISGRFGMTYTVVSNGNLDEELKAAIGHLPADIHFEYEDARPSNAVTTDFVKSEEETHGHKLSSYQLDSDGDVALTIERYTYNPDTEEYDSYQVLEKCDMPAKQAVRIKGLIGIRDTVRSHLTLMLSETDEQKFIASMASVNTVYDRYIAKQGPLNNTVNKRAFKADPDSALLLGLEKWNKQEKTASKSDIFTERTVFPKTIITHTDDVEDALLISLSEKGKVVPEYIESLTDRSWDELTNELGTKVMKNPETNEWEHSSVYLSGQVRDKLVAAKAAAEIDEQFKINVEVLTEVIPETIPFYEIRTRLGSNWIPASDMQDFCKYIITGQDEPCTVADQGNFNVAKVSGYWELNLSRYQTSRNSGRTESEFGTKDWPTDKLLFAIMNNKSIKVNGKHDNGNTYIKTEETAEANAKADLLKETFKQWIWEDQDRAVRLENIYNEKYNGYIEPQFDGSKVEINGLSPLLKGKAFAPRQNQLNAIMRYLVTGRALFLHEVGVGKSFAILGSIIKGKEIGKHSKAILTVPNSVFPQMEGLATSHFPNANILMLDAKKLNKDNRLVTLSQIATNNWDCIILPHSIAERLDVPEEFKLSLVENELDEVMQAINSVTESDRSYTASLPIKTYAKNLEKAKQNIEERMDSGKTYDTVNIAEMGIDAIFVDEADEFVNLGKVTNMNHVAGVAIREAKKARALFYLTQYINHRNGNEGVVLATGTDIRNNMADQFTMLRYLAPDLLEEQDISMFDDFIGVFGEVQTKFEIAPEGTGFIEKTRLSKFTNIPELLMLYRQVADVVSADQAGVIRPIAKNINVVSEPCEYLKAYMATLAVRAKGVRNGSPKKDGDNLLAISNDGKKAAIDMRLIDPSIPDQPGSKLNLTVKNVLETYAANKELNPSQIIFCDIGVPNNEGRFDVYNDIKDKLIAGGMDENKIVFARDYKTDASKQELQDKMNSGEIAVAIGSTENMGVGKNVQERLAAIHDVSVPWRPRDLDQRGGRIDRFGNMIEDTKRFKYTTKDSFDLFIWQKLRQKALFAQQTKQSPRDAAREFDEEIEPSYGEIMAIATGNPLIQEAIELESEVDRLGILERGHLRSKSNRQSDIKHLARNIGEMQDKLVQIKEKQSIVKDCKVTIFGKGLNDTEDADKAMAKAINKMMAKARKAKTGQELFEVGEISGSKLFINSPSDIKRLQLCVEHEGTLHEIADAHNVASLLGNMYYKAQNIEENITYTNSQIKFYEDKLTSISAVEDTKFPHAELLLSSKLRLTEVEKKIAIMSNAEDDNQVEDPYLTWNRMLDELNGQGLLADLNKSMEGAKQSIDMA